jgi:hypothetical protein
MATNFSNQSPADGADGCFAAMVELSSGDLETFGADGFFVAGAAADFPVDFVVRFTDFFGDPMYLPWKVKSVAKPSKKFGDFDVEGCYQQTYLSKSPTEIR